MSIISKVAKYLKSVRNIALKIGAVIVAVAVVVSITMLCCNASFHSQKVSDMYVLYSTRNIQIARAACRSIRLNFMVEHSRRIIFLGKMKIMMNQLVSLERSIVTYKLKNVIIINLFKSIRNKHEK